MLCNSLVLFSKIEVFCYLLLWNGSDFWALSTFLLSLLVFLKMSLVFNFATWRTSSCITLLECCFQVFLPCIVCINLLFDFPLFFIGGFSFKKVVCIFIGYGMKFRWSVQACKCEAKISVHLWFLSCFQAECPVYSEAS